jgi:hypothetical protein
MRAEISAIPALAIAAHPPGFQAATALQTVLSRPEEGIATVPWRRQSYLWDSRSGHTSGVDGMLP